ncbi:hypothetical protein [Nocardia arthritidis]|uniref:hypothetical protein n=1 Tax=Nocardia arthritidis TaxID=228602 RepID=UPI0007A5055A|nr:hypothetical protein [Nocardia arthritidis]
MNGERRREHGQREESEKDELTGVFVGAISTVLPQLQALVDDTGADELLVKTDLYSPSERCRSYELLMNNEAYPLTAVRSSPTSP